MMTIKQYKPGQLITICHNVYRVCALSKESEHLTACTFCDASTKCAHGGIKVCMYLMPYECYLKLVKPKSQGV
jgi:hypothetical protein